MAGKSIVVSVAAGEAHTVALTGDGRVFSWGKGMFGRLGTGSQADQLSPVQLRFGRKLNLVAVAAGAYHTLALADDGSVWSWGYNMSDGQLGFDGDGTATPCLLPNSESLNFKVDKLKAGGMTSVAIDSNGGLWVWGNCPRQSNTDEAGFTFQTNFCPMPVRDFAGQAVVQFACGNEHIVVLVRSAGKGEDQLVAYSWGTNKHGQLGLGHTHSKPCPTIVTMFDRDSPLAAYDVACGGFHTAVLARKKGQQESGCWTFGLGENGQLGLGTTLSSTTPQKVIGLPDSARLVSIDCGLFHTSAVSASGNVWSWGMERGMGLCPDARIGAESGDAISPLPFRSAQENGRFESPVQVACGAAHTVLVACGGSKLWSWGRGRSGVLGTGKSEDSLAPTPVQWPEQLADDVEEEKSIGNKEKKPEEDEQVEALQRRLLRMERYTSVLHRSIFGKVFEERNIPVRVLDSGDFDVSKEWESMVERAERGELVGLERLYRSMLSGVKERLMKIRVQEAVKECLRPAN